MNKRRTTLSVSKETLEIWNELSSRSHQNLGDIVGEIAAQIKILLNETKSERLSFAVLKDPKRKIIMIGILPMWVGTLPSSTKDEDIPKEAIKKIIEKVKKQ